MAIKMIWYPQNIYYLHHWQLHHLLYRNPGHPTPTTFTVHRNHAGPEVSQYSSQMHIVPCNPQTKPAKNHPQDPAHNPGMLSLKLSRTSQASALTRH